MKKYLVMHSERAVHDLDDICGYISINLGNNKVAEDMFYKLHNKINSLKYSPRRYRPIDNEYPHLAGVRIAHEGKYNIFYRIEDGHNVVLILAILYNGIDISKIKLDI